MTFWFVTIKMIDTYAIANFMIKANCTQGAVGFERKYLIKVNAYTLHIQLWLRLTGELSFLIGEKIDHGLTFLRSPIRF